jgi:proline iminopeptidase
MSATQLEIAYETVGHGDPLVVVHGGPGMGHHYLRALDALAGDRLVVYYDQRGSGRTPVADPGDIGFAGAIADLDEVRSALGLERIDLLGHSMGAWIAALYAAGHAERVRSLVLAHTGPPAMPELMKQFGARMEASRTAEDRAEMQRITASQRYADRDPATLEDLYRLRYAPFFRDRANRHLLQPRFTAITAENVLGYAERMMASFADQDPFGSLGRIACPTLVVHGELDPIPVAFAELLAARIADARLALLDGAAHFSFLEDTDRFTAAVEPFLAEMS